MIVMSVVWGALGVIDALLVRIQEAPWGFTPTLLLTPQEYYASITLHGMRDLFGFAQQLEFAIFIYFTFNILKMEPSTRF
jgi:heme/copper-type cytochrome/quinol oxidase subunit 1